MDNNIKRILIWSSWYRLSHVLIGLSTLLLLATGSLIRLSPMLTAQAADIHHYSSAGFLAGLVIRFILMVKGKPHERLSYLIPTLMERRGIVAMLRFYALLGKAPLPNWYAQNPFWKPLYLLIYLLLITQLITGIYLTNHAFLFGFQPRELHVLCSSLLLGFTLCHIFCSIWHDYASSNSDVSAIINGLRTFNVETKGQQSQSSQAVKFTPMDAAKAKRKK